MTTSRTRVDGHQDPTRRRASGDEDQRVLTAAEIGETVKRYRIRRRMRQGDLARDAGLSISFISQFERGLTNASISSLTRICSALGITAGSLFIAETSNVQVLPVEEIRSIELEGATKRVYSRPALAGTDVYTVDLEPGGSTGLAPYEHPLQHELVVCLAGSIAAEIAGNRHVLRVGDSIDFSSELPHRLLNIGTTPAMFAWIVVNT